MRTWAWILALALAGFADHANAADWSVGWSDRGRGGEWFIGYDRHGDHGHTSFGWSVPGWRYFGDGYGPGYAYGRGYGYGNGYGYRATWNAIGYRRLWDCHYDCGYRHAYRAPAYGYGYGYRFRSTDWRHPDHGHRYGRWDRHDRYDRHDHRAYRHSRYEPEYRYRRDGHGESAWERARRHVD